MVVFKDPGGWLENQPATDAGGPVVRGLKDAFSFVGLLPSSNEQDLIKRVIGVGGDTVACCDDQGRITVNGTPIAEPYLAPGNLPSRIPFRVTVPKGRLWVMGDHRDLSADSRYHMSGPGQGTVPVGNVIGRAFLIAWPLDRLQGISRPSYRTPAALGSPGAVRSPLGARANRSGSTRIPWNLRSLWGCWAFPRRCCGGDDPGCSPAARARPDAAGGRPGDQRARTDGPSGPPSRRVGEPGGPLGVIEKCRHPRGPCRADGSEGCAGVRPSADGQA